MVDTAHVFPSGGSSYTVDAGTETVATVGFSDNRWRVAYTRRTNRDGGDFKTLQEALDAVGQVVGLRVERYGG